jgi:hypothetical protein
MWPVSRTATAGRAYCPKRNRYSHEVAKVYVGGVNVGRGQFNDAMACRYAAHSREQAPENRAGYEFEER